MGNGSTSSIERAPVASMTSRSNPNATPAQSGKPRLQRRQQPFVERGAGQPAAPSLSQVRLESRPLLCRRGELVKAVRQLHAFAIELEPQRGARVRGIQTGERGLGCRIAMHEGQRFCSPAAGRLGCPSGSRAAVPSACAVDPSPARALRQLPVGGGEGIQLEMAEERLPISQSSRCASVPPEQGRARDRRPRSSAGTGKIPMRYHSMSVNSELCSARARIPATTWQIWKMSPLPAASRRFMAYSGEVCRK